MTYSALRARANPEPFHKVTVEFGKWFLVSDDRHVHLDSRDFGEIDSGPAGGCQHIVFRLVGRRRVLRQQEPPLHHLVTRSAAFLLVLAGSHGLRARRRLQPVRALQRSPGSNVRVRPCAQGRRARGHSWPGREAGPQGVAPQARRRQGRGGGRGPHVGALRPQRPEAAPHRRARQRRRLRARAARTRAPLARRNPARPHKPSNRRYPRPGARRRLGTDTRSRSAVERTLLWRS